MQQNDGLADGQVTPALSGGATKSYGSGVCPLVPPAPCLPLLPPSASCYSPTPLSRLHLSASYLCSPAPVLTASPAPLGGGGGGGPSSAYELPCAEKLGDNKDLNMRLFRHV